MCGAYRLLRGLNEIEERREKRGAEKAAALKGKGRERKEPWQQKLPSYGGLPRSHSAGPKRR